MKSNIPKRPAKQQHDQLISSISLLVNEARKAISRNINQAVLQTYWQVGKHIVEYEQKGKFKAEYGKELLLILSKELTLNLGKGFSRSNLTYMRLLYIRHPKSETLSHQLNWSHYFELLKIEDGLERNFYEQQAIKENWSVRELKRNKSSALFHRIALSKNKKEILELAKNGHEVEQSHDLIKDPYILANSYFLGQPLTYNCGITT